MEKTITWVPGYESIYQISSDGKVWNVKSGATLRGNVNSHGYVVVSLTKDGVKKIANCIGCWPLHFSRTRTTLIA